jgi:hypothetical protein
VAEHEMTTRATATKMIHIDFIHRDFEVGGIAQRYAAIQELNITGRWHDRTEAIGRPSPSLVYERYRKRIVDRDPGRKAERGRRREDGSGRLRLCSQLEVIVSLTLAHVALSISSTILPMEQVELLADLLGQHP